MKTIIVRSALLLLILLNVISCTQNQQLLYAVQPKTIPEPLRAKAWEANKKNLNKIINASQWNNLSRVGVTTKDNSASAKLNWANSTNHNYIISLNNFITFGEIVIQKSDKIIKIRYQDKEYTSDRPEELLYELTQLRVPVSELQYWILGLPSPKYPIKDYRLNQYAALASLKQGNFTIEYDDHESYNLSTTYILPMKILIKSPQLRLKIQVENWNL